MLQVELFLFQFFNLLKHVAGDATNAVKAGGDADSDKCKDQEAHEEAVVLCEQIGVVEIEEPAAPDQHDDGSEDTVECILTTDFSYLSSHFGERTAIESGPNVSAHAQEGATTAVPAHGDGE